jgi:membrane associated rhomboid family serine protease
MAVLYVVYEYYMGKKGGDNINHDAHLWGAIFGVVYTIGLKPSLALYFIEQLKNGLPS